ncbi:MAG: hypothetical protein ABR591_01750, partial [Candidatus Velthaea sp.]
MALANDGMQAAYAVGIDKTGKRGYMSVSAQDEPSGFTSLNTVSPPQRSLDLTLRRDFASGSSFGVNAALDSQRIPGGGASSDRRVTATY